MSVVMLLKVITLWPGGNMIMQQLKLFPHWPLFVRLSSVHGTKKKKKDYLEIMMYTESELIRNQMFRKKQ